ncbi:unnamed protein product [Caenorhabditis sp. 36 PRJEB53466]|nr:unnamed protein product [Caenorhabditis sp. 36 PRJEB53466]
MNSTERQCFRHVLFFHSRRLYLLPGSTVVCHRCRGAVVYCLQAVKVDQFIPMHIIWKMVIILVAPGILAGLAVLIQKILGLRVLATRIKLSIRVLFCGPIAISC